MDHFLFQSEAGFIAEPGTQPQKPRLLIVDDELINLTLLTGLFEHDHQVIAVRTAEAAIAACTPGDQLPDLILLDVEMPGLSGHALCRQLKEEPHTRDIPVIFVTGHHSVEEEAQCFELGAVDFIAKPVHAAVVRARVHTHLLLKHQADLLKRWVYVDGLTGVYNRRYFDARLQSEWARSARNHADLSIILLDIDHFKTYNDLYGHLRGDDCLRQVAQALQWELKRPGDILARFGGEEFVAILPETPLAGALVVAESLRRAIHHLALEHDSSSTTDVVTISLGVATRNGHRAHDMTPEDLLKTADEQLYLSKMQGRNQVNGVQAMARSPLRDFQPTVPQSSF